jgi:hypothetical protein
MNIGMLWFDNDPKTELASKVERAASYYQKKYGDTPTVCFVHPSMLPNGNGNASKSSDSQKGLTTAGVEVRGNQTVLPNHFWIGVNGSAQK